MYIHPLEAIGYYLILYSPAFIFRCVCVSERERAREKEKA